MSDLLRMERERRGLPDYDRPPPPAPKPERPKAQRMVECSKCREAFTADSFKAAGSANKRSKVCDACFIERYPHRHVPCSGCGKRIKTRGQSSDPTCRPCRRAMPKPAPAGPPPAEPHCPDCLEPIAGRTTVKGSCFRCYQRDYRARNRESSNGCRIAA